MPPVSAIMPEGQSSNVECSEEDTEGFQTNAARQNDIPRSIPVALRGLTTIGIRLGVTWKHLVIKATDDEKTAGENIITQFRASNLLRLVRPAKSTAILKDSDGCVMPGEMLLVLGQPDAGCNAILNLLAGRRKGNAAVTGDVWYGSMHRTEARRYRSAMTMTDDTDVFPTNLRVEQVLDFVLRSKGPRWFPHHETSSRVWYIEVREALIEAMGLRSDVSERDLSVDKLPQPKRRLLSLAESLATQPSVICWDNYNCGLDSRMTLQCTQMLRELTHSLGLATVASLHQADNAVYNLFDKVLVVQQGEQVYYGPANEARHLADNLTAVAATSSNTVNLLTKSFTPLGPCTELKNNGGVTRTVDPLGRSQEGMPVLTSPQGEADYPSQSQAREDTAVFKQTARNTKSLVTNFVTQLQVCGTRRRQTLRSDLKGFSAKQLSTILQAVTAGTLMYNAPQDSSGFSVKTGALFFSVLFHSLMALAVIPETFSTRPHMLKYKAFDLHNTAGPFLEQSAADLMSILVQVSVFSLPMYFLVGLTPSASAFFTYWTILVSKSMSLLAIFRFVAATCETLDTATIVSGLLSNVMVGYCGYVVSYPNMKPWFAWLFYINPDAWAYEALADNEYHGKIIACVGPNLIPSGVGYSDILHQACGGVSGAVAGSTFLTGDKYLASQGYEYSHLWRNVGFMWAAWLFFSISIEVIDNARAFASRNGTPVTTLADNLHPRKPWVPELESSKITHGKTNKFECSSSGQTVDAMRAETVARRAESERGEHAFVPSLWCQTRLAVQRMSKSHFRNLKYVNNKVVLHVALGLLNGFSYFQLGDSLTDQQLRQSTIFNFIFVAPGVVAQLQPQFLDTWHHYKSQEVHSRPYGWIPVVTGLVVSEMPYICVCTLLYFLCWYFTVGLPLGSSRAGDIFITMLAYGLIYTSMGQLIAACSPNLTFAAFVNPLLLGNFVAFCGILVPFSQIPLFWQSWAYWANPFTYMVGSLFIASSWGVEISCKEKELAIFNPPAASTCEGYLATYLRSVEGHSTHLLNPGAKAGCRVCPYKSGEGWCHSRNYQTHGDGWRYAGIAVLFSAGYYALLYFAMGIRQRRSPR